MENAVFDLFLTIDQYNFFFQLIGGTFCWHFGQIIASLCILLIQKGHCLPPEKKENNTPKGPRRQPIKNHNKEFPPKRVILERTYYIV